jgi:hypothetical protein
MRRDEFFGSSAISVAESLTGDDFLREVSFVASYMTFPGTCRVCPVVSQWKNIEKKCHWISEVLFE